jgi:hypothetical protein
MGFMDTLASTYSNIASYAQQNVIVPVSSRITSTGASVTAMITGQTPQNQVRQQQVQQVSQQPITTQPKLGIVQQWYQASQDAKRPSVIVQQASQIPHQQNLPPIVKQFFSISPVPQPQNVSRSTFIPQSYPGKSIVQTITAGMKPLSQPSFGGRMSGFVEQVGTGVRNIYEIPVQKTFQKIDQSSLPSETKTLAKVGTGLVFGIPQSVSETILAPGKITTHAVEGKLSSEDITTGLSFGMGLVLPSVIKGSGTALRSIGTRTAGSTVGYVAGKIPTVVGLGAGGLYAFDVKERMNLPVESGKFDKRPSTEKEIAEYITANPSDIFTGKETWTTSVPVMRAPTDMEYYRRGVGIGSTELVPMSMGAMLSPKFVSTPTYKGLTTPKGSAIFGKTPEGFKFGTIKGVSEPILELTLKQTTEKTFIPEKSLTNRIFPQQVNVKVLTGTIGERMSSASKGTTLETLTPEFKTFKVPKTAIPTEYVPDIQNLQGILRGENLPPRGTFPVAFEKVIAREEALTGKKMLGSQIGEGKQTISITDIGGTFEKPTYTFGSTITPTPGKFESRMLGTMSPEGSIIPDIFFTEKTMTKVKPEAYGISVSEKSPVEAFKEAFRPAETEKVSSEINDFWRGISKKAPMPKRVVKPVRKFTVEQTEPTTSEYTERTVGGRGTTTTKQLYPEAKLKYPAPQKMYKYRGYPIESVEEVSASRLRKMALESERSLRTGLKTEIKTDIFSPKTTTRLAGASLLSIQIPQRTKQEVAYKLSPLFDLGQIGGQKIDITTATITKTKTDIITGLITPTPEITNQATKEITKELFPTPEPPIGGGGWGYPKEVPIPIISEVIKLPFGSGGLSGWDYPTFGGSGRKLKIHKIPSPQELWGFGEATGKKAPNMFSVDLKRKSKGKNKTKSILEF